MLFSIYIGLLSGLYSADILCFSAKDIARYGIFLDDAYFYTVLAKNFRLFGFLTFDGTMPTNGVQPLWMAIQALVGFIFPDTDGATLLAWSSVIAFTAFVFFLTYYLSKGFKWGYTVAMVIPALFMGLNPEFHRLVIQGLETPIALLTIMLGIIAFEWFRRKYRSASQGEFLPGVIVLGLVATIVFFARTDMFWFATVIFIWLIINERKISRNVVAYSSTIAVLVIPYLIFNMLTAGSLMPISGRVKLFYLESSFPTYGAYLQSMGWAGMFHFFDRILGFTYLPVGMFVRYALILLLLLISFYIMWRLRTKKIFPPGFIILALTVIPHILFMHIFYRELRSYTCYYFAPEILYFVMFLGYITQYLLEKAKQKPSLIRNNKLIKINLRGIGCVIILIWASIIYVGENLSKVRKFDNYWTERVNLAEDIPRYVPEGEEVGAFWPGLFGQFSERTVVPLDGIIGSEDYFEYYLKREREIEFIKERGIRYIAVHLSGPPHEKGIKIDKANWAARGEILLRENPDIIERVVNFRPVDEHGKGWYLIEMKSD